MNDTTALLPDIRLRFNIEHPSFEDCYAFGYECATAEVSEAENPFRAGTKESDQWLEGWWAGFYGELPLYELSNEFEGEQSEIDAANDHVYHEHRSNFLNKVIEITSMLAVSAAVGYQLLDLVA